MFDSVLVYVLLGASFMVFLIAIGMVLPYFIFGPRMAERKISKKSSGELKEKIRKEAGVGFDYSKGRKG